MDAVPLVEDAAVVGVDEVVHLGRGLVRHEAGVNHFIGQLRRLAAGVDDQLGVGNAVEGGTEVDASVQHGFALGQRGMRVDADLMGQRLADGGQLAGVVAVDDEIAADDRQATVAALHAHVLGAVVIQDYVAGLELVVHAGVHGLGVLLDVHHGAVDCLDADIGSDLVVHLARSVGGGGETKGQSDGGSESGATVVHLGKSPCVWQPAGSLDQTLPRAHPWSEPA